MDETAPLILDIGIVLIAAAAAGWIARRIGLPAVVGYLAVGLLVSPFTPGYVAARNEIQLLADVGVTLLLFEVGIDIDLGRLRREQRSLLLLAPLQVAITTIVSSVALAAIGLPIFGASLLGIALASSSSVVVVNITRSRRRTTDAATERAMLGWSVVQDVAVVSAGVLVLAAGNVGGRSFLEALLGLVAFTVVAQTAAWVLPRALVRLRSEHDLFLILSVASGLAIAGIGDRVFGVPLALAAFVAGLSIAESPDTAEARRRLLPFRDVFAVLFFIAVGSLIDPAALAPGVPFLALLLGLLVVSKPAVIYVMARLARLDARPAQLAVGLSQIGEFSFVLAAAGLSAGAVTQNQFAAVLGAVVASIAVSAVLVRRVGGPVTGDASPPLPSPA